MTWYQEALCWLRSNADQIVVWFVCAVILVGVCLPFIFRIEDDDSL